MRSVPETPEDLSAGPPAAWPAGSPDDLDARVRQDLSFLNYPPANWVPPHAPVGGVEVADVTIIGGGMCGLVAWFALRRAGVANIQILDAAPQGQEGPWLTFARMETLRSPKQLLGPAFGVPSLTFQAWYRARFGAAAWDDLYRIPRPMWMDYLRWYRDVLQIPVENGVRVMRVDPRPDGLFSLSIDGQPARLSRKIVLATGRDGLGGPTIPGFMDGIERHRLWAHSADAVDFAALRGKRVVVIGVGASAVDNAAEALEAGAAEVRLLARRPTMPTVNKLMGIGSFGVTAAYPVLPPEWRWRIMDYAARQQTPAPHGSTLRVSRHANAHFHFNAGIDRIEETPQGVQVTTLTGRRFQTDFVILGTGFDIDPMTRPELEGFADRIACWEDRYTPPPDEANPALGRFPWLARDFGFTEKTPGAAPFLGDIHCFNYGAAISVGKVSGDIPAISEGAGWLAEGIAAQLFARDLATHWQALQDYAQPELDGTEWRDADSVPDAAAGARTA